MKKSKFTEQQIVRILQEASEGKKTQSELCAEHGVSQNTFYVWKRKYSGLETQDVRRLRELERENYELKKAGALSDPSITSAGRPLSNPQLLPTGCHPMPAGGLLLARSFRAGLGCSSFCRVVE